MGTLIDFEAGILDCLHRIAAESDVALDDAEALARFGRAEDIQQQLTPSLPFTQMLTPIYRRIAADLGLPSDDEHADALRRSVPAWPAFPDSTAALSELRANHRLVALTNADNWALAKMALTLGSPFDDAVTAEDVGVNKPDPQVFAYCAGRQSVTGYRRADWLHVAQSQYHDIATAQRLGIATCWIERRRGQRGSGATPEPAGLTQPTYHYGSLRELASAARAAS